MRGERGLTGEEVLQLRHLKLKEREKERKVRLCLKDLELTEEELSLQLKIKELKVKSKESCENLSAAFDVSECIKFVPDFGKQRLTSTSSTSRK